MLFLRAAAVFCFFLAGCSGSGGFTEGFKLGKKDAKGSNEDAAKKDHSGKDGEEDGGSADQPVQITGTYLTCSEVSADESEATFGCRLANKLTGMTVALSEIATQWEFNHDLIAQVPGHISMRGGDREAAWQIFFDFEAVDLTGLRTLIAATRILLDLDLRLGAGKPKDGPEFAGLITSFVPVGQSEIISGTQQPLDNNIINTVQPDSPPTTTTSQPPTGPPADKPDPAGPTPETSTVTPAGPPKEPVVTTPPKDANPDPGSEPADNVVVKPASVSSADPVVTFSAVYKAGGAMALMAAFDQDGLSDAKFSGGGIVEATNIKINPDGSATYRLSAPISVSVKKGAKTCSASGAIITGNMSLPLVCE